MVMFLQPGARYIVWNRHFGQMGGQVWHDRLQEVVSDQLNSCDADFFDSRQSETSCSTTFELKDEQRT